MSQARDEETTSRLCRVIARAVIDGRRRRLRLQLQACFQPLPFPSRAIAYSGVSSVSSGLLRVSATRFLVMLFRDQHVERRHDEKSEDRSDGHSADEHQTDRISRRRAGAGDQGQRKVTGHGGDTGHHDRAQTDPRRLRDRGEFRQAFALQFIRKLHDQNSVLGNEADQRHQSDLRVNVERRRPAIGKEFSERHLQKHEDGRAEQGQRHRAEQNDERIAEAVELRGQNQKDQDNREQEDAAEFVALESAAGASRRCNRSRSPAAKSCALRLPET